SSGSLKYAGARGFLPVSANFIAPWSVATHWPAYADAARAAGREPDPATWRVARSIYVDETDAAAARSVATEDGPFDYYYKYLFAIFDRANFKQPFVAAPGDDPARLTPQALRDACVIHGSPETVARKILELMEQTGPFGTLLYAA